MAESGPLTNLDCVRRVPALKVLALDAESGHFLANGIIESAGPSLQYLQLGMAEHGPGSQLWGANFWSAVKGCTKLVALNLLFEQDAGHTDDQQVGFRDST